MLEHWTQGPGGPGPPSVVASLGHCGLITHAQPELARIKKFDLLKLAFDVLPQLTPGIIRSEIELNKRNK